MAHGAPPPAATGAMRRPRRRRTRRSRRRHPPPVCPPQTGAGGCVARTHRIARGVRAVGGDPSKFWKRTLPYRRVAGCAGRNSTSYLTVAGCARPPISRSAGCPGSPSGTAHPIAESQDVRAATAHPISRSQDVRGRQSVAQHNTLSQSRRMCAVVAGCAGCPAARPITRAGSPSGTAHPIAESQDVPAHFPGRVARRRP